MNQFKSKRFIAYVVAVVIYVGLVFLTKYTPMDIATSISIISGLYIGAETLKRSTPEI